MQSRGSFLCDGGTCCDGVKAMLFLDRNLASGLILMIKQRCKQSVKSVGMACEGRARNRMLRKRWIVRSKRWIVRNPGRRRCYAVHIGTIIQHLIYNMLLE